jgi:hypothetical protein
MPSAVRPCCTRACPTACIAISSRSELPLARPISAACRASASLRTGSSVTYAVAPRSSPRNSGTSLLMIRAARDSQPRAAAVFPRYPLL